MGEDKIRHLLPKPRADGSVAYYWNPSKTIRDLGMVPEALGTDAAKAKQRATELNGMADAARRSNRAGDNGPKPGSVALLFRDYQTSDEFKELKPRTRDDYSYYLGKIEAQFRDVLVIGMTARVCKTYYKRLRRDKGVVWSYHVLATLRAALTWAVSEDWIKTNPALSFEIQNPRKRTVVWEPDQGDAYRSSATALGWHSVAVMVLVFDCIGQSPGDVRMLTRRAYDGERISVTRAKTGISDAPILLWPDVRAALDAYLATRPTLHPDAPLFAHDTLGGFWKESTLAKTHNIIRKQAGLPKQLQLQDFRRTAQTEGGAAGGTVDELRGLARHATRTAALHYVHPDERFVDAIQEKRATLRTKRAKMSE